MTTLLRGTTLLSTLDQVDLTLITSQNQIYLILNLILNMNGGLIRTLEGDLNLSRSCYKHIKPQK